VLPFDSTIWTRPIRLCGAVERRVDEDENVRGIFVTMSTRQVLENKGEQTGGDKNLMFIDRKTETAAGIDDTLTLSFKCRNTVLDIFHWRHREEFLVILGIANTLKSRIIFFVISFGEIIVRRRLGQGSPRSRSLAVQPRGTPTPSLHA